MKSGLQLGVNSETKREIGAFDIPQGEQPMCEKCFMPMVAESAEAKKVK